MRQPKGGNDSFTPKGANVSFTPIRGERFSFTHKGLTSKIGILILPPKSRHADKDVCHKTTNIESWYHRHWFHIATNNTTVCVIYTHLPRSGFLSCPLDQDWISFLALPWVRKSFSCGRWRNDCPEKHIMFFFVSCFARNADNTLKRLSK